MRTLAQSLASQWHLQLPSHASSVITTDPLSPHPHAPSPRIAFIQPRAVTPNGSAVNVTTILTSRSSRRSSSQSSDGVTPYILTQTHTRNMHVHTNDAHMIRCYVLPVYMHIHIHPHRFISNQMFILSVYVAYVFLK